MLFRAKNLFILGIIAVVAALVYWFYPKEALPLPPNKIVEVEKIVLGTISETEEMLGSVRSRHSTILMAHKSGVLDVLVNAGTAVKKGTLIAKIENADIERNYAFSQQLADLAKAQYDRTAQLLDSGASSKSLVEEQMKNWIEAQKRLTEAKTALDDILIEAPFDGVLGLFRAREGSQVAEGNSIVALYDPTVMVVEVDLPLNITERITGSATAVVNAKTYPLSHVQKILDQETHMSPVDINIECPECVIGSTISVKLVLTQKSSVLTLPYEAVFLRDGKECVYHVKNNKVELAFVTLGLRDKSRVEIISGVQEGDAVIIRGQGRLYPGMPVSIYQEPSL